MRSKPKRLNTRQIRKLKDIVRTRDGDACNLKIQCDSVTGQEVRAATGRDLILHHRNHNPADNRLENLALTCQPCNIAERPRGKGRGAKFNNFNGKKMLIERGRAVQGERLTELLAANEHILSAEFKKNLECEPKFKQWLARKIKKHGQWELDDVINAGAEHAGCSIQTAMRYLRKLMSSEGRYAYKADELGIKYVTMKGRDNGNPGS